MSTPGDEERVPAHVAWVAADPRRRGDAPPVGDRGDRALLDLVDAAAEIGVAWLTVQEPTGGRVLRERSEELADRGVRVLGWPDLGPVPLDAGAPSELRVLAAPPASGKAALVDAVRRLADAGVAPKSIDEKTICETLAVPDVDLLVVTGGDRRVPDLLLWQVAYSEIVFLPDPWPRAGRAQLAKAVEEYRRRDRRYGGLVVSR